MYNTPHVCVCVCVCLTAHTYCCDGMSSLFGMRVSTRVVRVGRRGGRARRVGAVGAHVHVHVPVRAVLVVHVHREVRSGHGALARCRPLGRLAIELGATGRR